MFADRFRNAVYTLGNHEYYGSDRDKVHASVRRATESRRNVSWLECSSMEIEGTKFAGATLWFPFSAGAPKWRLNDFRPIEGFEGWVYDAHDRAVSYLDDEIRPIGISFQAADEG